MNQENRTERFEIRLKKSEKELLFQYAALCGFTPTDYVRTLIWCLKPAKLPIRIYEQMLKELKDLKLQVNESLAYMKLTGDVPHEDFSEAAKKIDNLSARLEEAIQHPLEAIEPENVKKLQFQFLNREEYQ